MLDAPEAIVTAAHDHKSRWSRSSSWMLCRPRAPITWPATNRSADSSDPLVPSWDIASAAACAYPARSCGALGTVCAADRLGTGGVPSSSSSHWGSQRLANGVHDHHPWCEGFAACTPQCASMARSDTSFALAAWGFVLTLVVEAVADTSLAPVAPAPAATAWPSPPKAADGVGAAVW